MAIAEELIVVIKAEVANAVKNIHSVTSATEKSQSQFGKFTSFLKTTGIGSFLAVGTAIATTVKFLKSAEEAARSAEEIFSKFNFVFERVGNSAQNAAAEFAKNFGLADSTAKELLGTTGDLLVGMGATEGQALDLSVQVNTLAADLASFSNVQGGTKRASDALTKALLGERESAKLLGVVIRETDVEQKLMEKGQQNLTGQALLLAKAQATLEIATEQSQKAIGDYARTSESASNVAKRLEQVNKGLSEAIGKSIVQAITPLRSAWANVAEQLTDVIEKSNALSDAHKAQRAGNETIEQRILLLSSEIENMERAIKVARQYGDVSASEQKLALLKQELRYVAGNMQLAERQAENERKTAQEREQQKQKEAEAAAEAAKHLEALKDAWARTEEGQIAALKSSIAYFESFKDGPMVQAVLRDLRAELLALQGNADAVTESIDGIALATEQYVSSIKSDMQIAIEQFMALQEVITDLDSDIQAMIGTLSQEGFLSTLDRIGEAWAKGESGAKAATESMMEYVALFMKNLSKMLLDAGLKAITSGGPEGIALGLALIAASGLVALGSGYVKGRADDGGGRGGGTGGSSPPNTGTTDKTPTVIINFNGTVTKDDEFDDRIVRAVYRAYRGY